MSSDRSKAEETAGLMALGGGALAGAGAVVAVVADRSLFVALGLILAFVAQMVMIVGLVAFGVEIGVRSSGVSDKLDELYRIVRRLDDGRTPASADD